MNFNDFDKISNLAQEYLQGEEKDDIEKTGSLLLEFIETLGYTDRRVVYAGAYNMSSQQTFEYALKLLEEDDSSDRLYVKLVSVNEDLGQFEPVIKETIVAQTHHENVEKFYIITNGFVYKIYSNTVTSKELVNLKELGTFSISNLKQSDFPLIQKISLQGMTGEIKEPIVDFSYEDEDQESTNIDEKEPQNNMDEKNNKFNFKMPEMNEKNKSLIKKIILIILAGIILFLLFKFLTANPETPIENNNEITTENVTTETNNSKINLTATNKDSENYISISAILDLTVSSKDELSMKLISNLEKDAIIKLGIFCGDNSSYIYAKTDSQGGLAEVIQIPETWGEQKVTVGAYLKFDEKGYEQPKSITDKYGKSGEYISWNPDYTENMITFSEINHSNELVETLLKERNAQKERELMNSIEKDFSLIDSRVDAFGNIKHIPKGYSFDETNISENVNIYPMIYYDKASNTSYFYMIFGYVGTQFVRFENVGFSCDGYNWKYENGTNQKKDKIVGNKKAEWIYFNNIDTPELLADMSLVSASTQTQLYLSGSVNAGFNISDENKAMIKQFLYIYETYYGNGTYVPNTSWFETTGTKVSLDYIKKPYEMRQRGSSEINSLITLQNALSQKRLNNETITNDEELLLETMKKTFRPVSETVNQRIYDSIISSTPIAIYYDDYETDKDYYKIYFYYDKQGEIENGYIPYINIYKDKTVIVPIKTISATTTGYDKVYAQYSITDTFYSELTTYFNGTQYVQFE